MGRLGSWRKKGLIRTGDGCFQHMITGNPNDSEILIDTLFMAVLFLARAGRLLNRPDYIEEAKYQVLCHIKYLLNKMRGCFTMALILSGTTITAEFSGGGEIAGIRLWQWS